MTDIIEEIKQLPRYNERVCECGEKVKTHVLQVHSVCPRCGREDKQRAFGGIGTEIHDVIDTVLEWAGTGEDLEQVLKRHAQIHEHLDLLEK